MHRLLHIVGAIAFPRRPGALGEMFSCAWRMQAAVFAKVLIIVFASGTPAAGGSGGSLGRANEARDKPTALDSMCGSDRHESGRADGLIAGKRGAAV